MNKKTVLILTIVLIPTLFYLIVLGGPIPNTLTIGDCKSNYTYYITNNFIRNMITNGHSSDNTFELMNSNNEIGRCLCDKYINNKNLSDSIKIAELVISNEDLINQYKDILKEKHVKNIVVDTVCNNRDFLFSSIGIE